MTGYSRRKRRTGTFLSAGPVAGVTDADKPCMQLRRISLAGVCCWAGPGLSLCAQAKSIGVAGSRIAMPPAISIVGPILAAGVFFLLWLTSWLRERRHLNMQQNLHLQLLARDGELEREKGELAAAREALRVHAIRDELTGLPNRTSIVEVLDREMARAVRDKSTLSVVLADVDHLAKINETHGVPAGDEILKEMGRRLEFAIRSYDTAGRYSGGDFLLVLPSFEADTGVERLRKIHDMICGRPMPVPSGSLQVTCSFGVSILPPEHFYSAEELLERAAQAMSTAKQDGRNRIGFFARSES